MTDLDELGRTDPPIAGDEMPLAASG